MPLERLLCSELSLLLGLSGGELSLLLRKPLALQFLRSAKLFVLECGQLPFERLFLAELLPLLGQALTFEVLAAAELLILLCETGLLLAVLLEKLARLQGALLLACRDLFAE